MPTFQNLKKHKQINLIGLDVVSVRSNALHFYLNIIHDDFHKVAFVKLKREKNSCYQREGGCCAQCNTSANSETSGSRISAFTKHAGCIEYRSDDVTKVYFWNCNILTMWSERAPCNRNTSKVSDK